MAYENVRLEVEGGVATLTISRPKALNALDAQTVEEIDAAVAEAEASAEVVGIIVTGDGEKAFVAGADISNLAEVRAADAARRLARRGQAMCARISACKKPVIACINGYALGGGLELALACHFRYATSRAKVGLPEVSLGLIPGYGGTQRLSRIVGRGRATEMIVSGDPIGAEAAEAMGLVNRVFEDKAGMLAGAQETLGTVAKRGPVAVGLALEAIERGLELPLPGALEVEADLFGVACSTADAAEGTKAFLEKRAAEFKGA